MTKIVHDPDPGPLRAKAYPSVGDQLDAIWKTLQTLSAEMQMPPETVAMLEKINAVKARYAKGNR